MSTRQATRQETILVIDSNSSWAEWAVQVLESDGYDAQMAPFSKSVAASVGARKPNLIILGVDIAQKNLGDMSRLASRRQRPLRFLVVSPVRLSYHALRSLWRGGASDIQSKPFERRALLKMVTSELQPGECSDESDVSPTQHSVNQVLTAPCS